MVLDLVLIAGGTVFQSMDYDEKAIDWITEQIWKKHDDDTEKAEDDQEGGGFEMKTLF